MRSTSGERVPYAIVTLIPAQRQLFADDSGAFWFGEIAPGSHRLLVRQIGFSPFDTTIVVRPDGALTLTLQLTRVTVQLSEITVSARAECVRPGPPDPALHPQLAVVFEQLKQNAERYRFWADSYPAEYRMERTLGYLGAAGEVRVTSTDTVQLRTDARWRYAPGRVIADLGRGGSRLLLPTLPDLADSAFQAGHCFYLLGLDTTEAGWFIRMDFTPPERLRSPDVEGSAYLDAASFQIRHATVRLTHPSRALWSMRDLTVRMSFQEVHPSIALVSHITAVQRLLPELGRATEEQRLLAVHFLRPLSSRQ